VVAFVAATACARVYRQAHAALALGGCAVVWAAAAAYLAVPGDVAAPRLMLTGAVSGAASIIVARGIAVGITAFTAAASVSLLSALAAAVSALLPLTVAAVGALLAAAGVATLAFAARLALWGARARVPSLPGSAAGFHADPDRTHALATGLVCGSCVAAALGAVLTTQAGVVFATVVGVVLVLRTGTYVDLIQVSALIASGAACFASAFLWAVRAHPHIAPWLSLVAAAVAAAGVGMSAASGSASVSPLARRCAELVEYAALAALLPLACWVGGAFDAVRAL
jgi:type VII secretion integral membrane protein EccD